MGPRTGLDGCGKSRSQPGLDPQTVQLVVELLEKGKGKVHPCTGTGALYRPYGP